MLFLNFSGLNYEKYLEYRRIMPIYLTSAHGLCGLTEKMLIHFFHKKIVCSDVFLYIGRRMTDIPTGRTGIRRDFRKVRQAAPTLGEAFGKSDRLSQRLEKLSESPTERPNARRSFRKVRRSVPTLGEAFGKSDGASQRSEKLSESPTEHPNARRSCRKVRRSVPTLGEAVGKSDGASKRSEKLSESPTGRQNVRRDFRTFRRKNRMRNL